MSSKENLHTCSEITNRTRARRRVSLVQIVLRHPTQRGDSGTNHSATSTAMHTQRADFRPTVRRHNSPRVESLQASHARIKLFPLGKFVLPVLVHPKNGVNDSLSKPETLRQQLRRKWRRRPHSPQCRLDSQCSGDREEEENLKRSV